MAEYNHCDHCNPDCHASHTVPCHDCDEGGRGTVLVLAARESLVESFNAVLKAIEVFMPAILDAGVDPDPVVTMLEGFVTALTPPPPPTLRQKVYDEVGLTEAEIGWVLDQVVLDVLETPVPLFTTDLPPEAGYAAAQSDFVKRLRGE